MDINFDNGFKNNLILTLKICKENEKSIFDYDNIIKEKTFRLFNDGRIIKKKDSIKFIPTQIDKIEESEHYLCRDEFPLLNINFNLKNDVYLYSMITSQEITNSPRINLDVDAKNIIWKVVKKENKNAKVFAAPSNNSSFSQLKKYDVIKLGKVKLYVSNIIKNKKQLINMENQIEPEVEFLKVNHKVIVLEDSKRSLYSLSPRTQNSVNNIKTMCKIKIQCRVCYSTDSTDENPLISLCNCTGSVQNIHYECLQAWIIERSRHKQTGDVTIIKCKLYCELCKTPLPTRFTFNDLVYPLIENLLEFDDDKDYIILESIDCRTDDYYQYIYIVNLKENTECLIGKDKTCPVRVKDQDVSHQHAAIVFQNDRVSIIDKNSKFGTYIQQRKQVIKVGKNEKTFQMGNVLFTTFIKINSEIINDSKFSDKNYNSAKSSDSNILNTTYLSDQYETIISKLNIKDEDNFKDCFNLI